MPIFVRTTIPTVSTFRPIRNNTLARRVDSERESGGIILPDKTMTTHMATFDIVAVGPKCEVVKVGDKAMLPCQLKFSKVELKGVTYEVIPEDDFHAYEPS